MLFMGVQPEFYTCPNCRVAFDLETLRPMAKIIGSDKVKELILLRGLPGSGKSTVAHQIVSGVTQKSLSVIVCSADDYFMENGQYVFQPDKLEEAHKACQMSVDRSMANGFHVVIVDNTNIKKEHMQPYLGFAKQYGYSVDVKTIGGFEKEDVEKYLERQTHGVPRGTLERMAGEYEE
jgi:predicted kinase